jgi:hypothetical protein
MTYKAELEFARQAIAALTNANAWRIQAAGADKDPERQARCLAIAKTYTLEGRLAEARANAVKQRREEGDDSRAQADIAYISAKIEKETA